MNGAVAEEKKFSTADAKNIKTIGDVSLGDKSAPNNGKRNMIIATSISVVVMLVAVLMIFFYTQGKPEITKINDQSTAISENTGFVNPDSMQQLEHDANNITFKLADNSTTFIAISVGLMILMLGAFVFVKIAENKEDN